MLSITRRGFLTGTAAMLGVPAWARGATEDERLHRFFEQSFDRRLALDPMLAADVGVDRAPDRWPDLSERHQVARAAAVRRDLGALRQFDYRKLTSAAQLSYRLFEYRAQRELEDFRWRRHTYLVTHLRGIQRVLPRILINRQSVSTPADAEAFVRRLHGVRPLMSQLVEQLRRQEATGVRPPRFTYARVISMCEGLLRGAPLDSTADENPIYASFASKLAHAGIAGAQKNALLRKAQAGLREGVGAGYRQLIDHLRQAERAAPENGGVWRLPQGDHFYSHLLHAHTTLPLTAQAVHEIGLQQVERIRGEMTLLMRRTGFRRPLDELFGFLRNDPQFYFPDTDAGRAQYLAQSQALLDQLAPRLGELMTHPPRQGVAVKRIEAWLESSAGTAGYSSPANDRDSGTVYFNLRDMALMPKYELAALSYHEGIPGHHVENTIGPRLAELPRFRRFDSGYTAHSEGWALYAEELPKLIGLYQDAYQDFGRLSMELTRAARLVVDSGIHALRWTKQQAIDWLDRSTSNSHADNTAAVERYSVAPGQATAYQIGKLKFVELREFARQRLGSKFDLRAYHDQVLGSGSMPLPILEENVKAWIETQVTGAANMGGMSSPRVARRVATAVALLVVPFLALSQPAKPSQASETEQLNEFFDHVFERNLSLSPTRQSRMGIKTDQDKWDDISDARGIQSNALLRADLAALDRFDYDKLSRQAQLSYRMFEFFGRDSLRSFDWRRNDYLVTQMGGWHTRVATTLINNHPIVSRADADAYIARLGKVKPLMQQLVEKLRLQEAAGVKPPRFVYPLVIDACENLLNGRPFTEATHDSPLYADFKKKVAAGTFSQIEQDALLDRAQSALLGGVGPGYGVLIEHLRNAHATASDDAGVWKLPRGKQYYEALIESYTTLPLRAGELHRVGVSEVARIQRDMHDVMRKIGFEGTLAQFFEHVRSDSRFYYSNDSAGRERYLQDARELLAEIVARQGELFTVRPKADVIVQPVEAWRERSAAKAFYDRPPPDGSRPGIFYINLYDMRAAPKYQLASILYHEAVPGHHFETTLAMELADLPKFRRYAGVTAFSEGWSLYAEQVPKEMGLYQDPYQDFGRLASQLLRAARLVVDTGIHSMKWTREHAIEYLDRNLPNSHYDNAREIERYIVAPGQATAYAVGMLEIQKLRQRARKKLGERLDVRHFHDAVLGSGPMPLPMLRDVIAEWIDSQEG